MDTYEESIIWGKQELLHSIPNVLNYALALSLAW